MNIGSGYWKVITLFFVGFIVVAVAFAWNGYEFSQIFIRPTNKTSAKIESIKTAYESRWIEVQRVRFKFHDEEGMWHNGFAKITPMEGFREFGDVLNIEYSVSNPKKTEVISYQTSNGINLKERYIYDKLNFVKGLSKTYKELRFYKSLFFLKTYGLGGVIIREDSGDVMQEDDLIQLRPYDLKNEADGPYLPMIELIKNDEVLINSTSGESFRAKARSKSRFGSF